ncbi:protein containing catalytic phage domain protein : [Gemmata massiliana]|uniref:Protein containing catalytic phage domain protein n=1 Tax=Gemmata massiliana TaxID=1210884 RepID=A0A6P2CXP0_9BACT|nr:hypothetical protein [Gemmata massiliana]VTR92554.1 protein containing catalytic phage domain protein : [Gemmata massiliana]
MLVTYYRHATGYYAHQEGTLNRIRTALEAVDEMFADLPVSGFRGPHLKRLREHLVANRKCKKTGAPLSRTYVNHLVSAVQMCWRWALSEDLVPADVAGSLLAVERLRRGGAS